MAQIDSLGKAEGLSWSVFLIGAWVSMLCGLDRVAVLQVLLSRPLVAAPLTAWLLGAPAVGLQIGVMVELLWLARLPVGAAVPPDDTQVAVATSVLAIVFAPIGEAANTGMMVLCLLIALPLGKMGQYFERAARQLNNGLPHQAEAALAAGKLELAERQHLKGLFRFAGSAFLTYCLIVAGGMLLVPLLWPWCRMPLVYSADWIQLALPLTGMAVILGTINVSRAMTLFCTAFGMAFLLMWLVR